MGKIEGESGGKLGGESRKSERKTGEKSRTKIKKNEVNGRKKIGRLVWWGAPALWHEVGVALLRRGVEHLPCDMGCGVAFGV